MTHATLIPLATFLQHYGSFVLDSFRKHSKYLNSNTCSNRTPSTQISSSNPSSQFSTITLLLHPVTFRSLLLHTSTKRPAIALTSSSDLPPRTKSSTYKKPRNFYSLPTPPLEISLLIFTFLNVSVYTFIH